MGKRNKEQKMNIDFCLRETKLLAWRFLFRMKQHDVSSLRDRVCQRRLRAP